MECPDLCRLCNKARAGGDRQSSTQIHKASEPKKAASDSSAQSVMDSYSPSSPVEPLCKGVPQKKKRKQKSIKQGFGSSDSSTLGGMLPSSAPAFPASCSRLVPRSCSSVIGMEKCHSGLCWLCNYSNALLRIQSQLLALIIGIISIIY